MGYSHAFAPQGRPLTEEEAAVLAGEVLAAARARLRQEAAPTARGESRRLPLALALRLHPEHFIIAGVLSLACAVAAWQVFAHFG